MTAYLLSLATCSWPRAMTPSFMKRSSTGTSCRVCAGVVENTYTYTCHEETNKTLQKKFGIYVDKDQPNIHPKVYFARAPARRPLSIQCTESALKVFQWTPLTDPALVVRSVVFSKKTEKGRETKEGEEESWTAALPTCCEQDPA